MQHGQVPKLADYLESLLPDHNYSSAFLHLPDALRGLTVTYGLHDLLEVGGGRTPHFDLEDAAELGVDLWVSDISQKELDQLPDDYRTLTFDIASPVVDEEYVDLVFSRSLLEHVNGTDTALHNCYRMLRPDGIMFHMIPTMFCAPFVANKILPERVSNSLVKSLSQFDHEKFPALYDRTTSGAAQVRRMQLIGFRDIAVVPFWSHGYFHRLPVIREVEGALSNLARRRGWRFYTSYAWLVGRK